MALGFMIENGFMRIKPCRHGLMLYNVNDVYIGRGLDAYGELVPEEFRLLSQIVKPGQMVLDLGANIGMHTVFFAKAVGPTGRVMAFEPQRFLHNMLCGNLALNALINAHALHAAVGRESGTARVPLLDPGKPNNFGGISIEGRDTGEEVRLVAVDELNLAACHLMKIDVEGMELDVVEGAAETMARHKPVVYMENNREEKSPALIERMLSLGYRLYWHVPPLFSPDNFRGVGRNIFGNTVNVNMLCLPETSATNVTGLRRITGPEDQWRDQEQAAEAVPPAPQAEEEGTGS